MSDRPEARLTNSAVAAATIPVCSNPELSVVMVTYRTGEIVLRSLGAVAETLADRAYEVIVVDNRAMSAMTTPTLLRLRTAGVRLIESPTNAGFGVANNVGVAAARGETICLLNPDAMPTRGWIDPLLRAVTDPSVGIAAPVLLDPDGTVQEAGMSIAANGDTAAITAEPGDDIVDVDYSSAACWVMRREVFERLGGFDPSYSPAYFEDADLAMTAAHAGLRRVVCRASRVVHHIGGSTPGRRRPAMAQQEIFMTKWGASLRAATRR